MYTGDMNWSERYFVAKAKSAELVGLLDEIGATALDFDRQVRNGGGADDSGPIAKNLRDLLKRARRLAKEAAELDATL